MPYLENFIYLERQRIVFAYVPKAACTNWKSVLRYLAGQPDYLDHRLAHDRQRSGLTYLSTLPPAQREELLSSDRVRRISFVRSPQTRVLSAYRNKFEPFNDPAALQRAGDDFWARTYRSIRDRVHGAEPGRAVLFPDFLRWLEDGHDPMTRNEHWAPMVDILSPETVRFDFIGRMENLAHDAAVILQMMGCDIAFPTQADVKFPPTDAARHAPRYYDAETTATVRRLYARDFEVFGYHTES